MDLGQLDDFLDETLTFTHAGVTYTVAPVDAVMWARLVKTQAAVERGDGSGAGLFADAVEMSKVVLGSVYDDLIAAGASAPAMQRVTRAAYYWQLGEPQIATLLWGEGEGKVPTPASGSTSTTPTGSTSSASVSGTKRRVSTTGTRSRTTSKPRSPAKKAAPTR